MGIYKKWLEQKEQEGYDLHAPIKTKHKFEWGFEHIGLENSENPSEAIINYNIQNTEESKKYFVPHELTEKDFTFDGQYLTFKSTIQSLFPENNTAFFELNKVTDKKSIIIVIPHWNASPERYQKLCKTINGLKFNTLRMILPYHAQRGDGSEGSSTRMVSANIGLTLQAMQQSVRDLISCVDWLKITGYEKIGILSASIGSCVGFLAASHDNRINKLFANLMSSYFGEVVWTGLSTEHIKKSLEDHISLDLLRKSWLLNSPINFIDKIHIHNPALKQFIASGKYDTTFKYYLTQQIFEAYKENKIDYKKMVLPCGHYTLGRYIFKYIDGIQIMRFFSDFKD